MILTTPQWSRDFHIRDEDLDYLTNLLLDQETPMTSTDLALRLIQKRLEEQRTLLQDRYQHAHVYQPSRQYMVGDRLIFAQFDYATGVVNAVRHGENPNYGTFSVISVTFDDPKMHLNQNPRDFATEFNLPHPLNDIPTDIPFLTDTSLSPQDILNSNQRTIIERTEAALRQTPNLIRVAGYWFPRDLVLEVDLGVRHLADAVLDINQGGPLSPEAILDEIGGLGSAPRTLQVFSLNVALSQDDRFDEVGPSGQVLWYLRRMEPDIVRQSPPLLRYKTIPYDEDLLTDEMFYLETELDDELTPIEFEGNLNKATIALLYPHRRTGTLPFNAKMRQIFPTARTPRIYVELVDEADGEVFNGWVVHQEKYIYGLKPYYDKHGFTVGAELTVKRGAQDGQYILSYEAFNRQHSEWIRVLMPSEDTILFENQRRVVNAHYNDLLVIGIDDLDRLDRLVKHYESRTLAHILRQLALELGKLSPQNAVHAVTLYSGVNVFRRCPPGAILAILQANPDFEDVGNHYWRVKA